MFDDPLVLYPGAAALVLLAISLLTGWARLDFLALARPAVLTRVCLAVLAAFALTVVADIGLPAGTNAVFRAGLVGLALIPLYLIALAYGPTAGLVAAVLFAPLAAGTGGPSWPELLLAAELVVLGWLSIYPSPRQYRWAGPVNMVLARALIVMSAGVAALTIIGADVSWGTLLAPEVTNLPGTVVAFVVMFAFGPAAYRRLFPASRVGPRTPDREREAVASTALGEQLAPLRTRPARCRRLDPVQLDADDPNS